MKKAIRTMVKGPDDDHKWVKATDGFSKHEIHWDSEETAEYNHMRARQAFTLMRGYPDESQGMWVTGWIEDEAYHVFISSVEAAQAAMPLFQRGIKAYFDDKPEWKMGK